MAEYYDIPQIWCTPLHNKFNKKLNFINKREDVLSIGKTLALGGVVGGLTGWFLPFAIPAVTVGWGIGLGVYNTAANNKVPKRVQRELLSCQFPLFSLATFSLFILDDDGLFDEIL